MWEDKDGWYGGLLFLLITVSVLLEWELAMLSGATLDVSRRRNSRKGESWTGDTERAETSPLHVFGLDPIEN